MPRFEFQTAIQDDGQIPLPGEIRKRLGLKPNQKIKVIIEVPQAAEKRKSYSFGKVRKLLESIDGDMSDEIIADRKDRI